MDEYDTLHKKGLSDGYVEDDTCTLDEGGKQQDMHTVAKEQGIKENQSTGEYNHPNGHHYLLLEKIDGHHDNTVELLQVIPRTRYSGILIMSIRMKVMNMKMIPMIPQQENL